jgi:hypothetical protein
MAAGLGIAATLERQTGRGGYSADWRVRPHIAALTRLGQVMVVSPVVIVEARQRTGEGGRVDVVLARLEQDSITPEDGRGASAQLREAGRLSGDPRRRIQQIGLADALVATLAERLGGVVYTGDPQHLGGCVRQAPGSPWCLFVRDYAQYGHCHGARSLGSVWWVHGGSS